MAAELLLSFAAEEILKKLQSVVTDAITGAWGLKDDLQKLSDSMGRLQSLLQKAQNVPAVEDDESIKRWLEKLQEVVYAAADVLDEFHYEILRRKVEVKNQLKRKVRDFVSFNNPILFRLKMAAKVKEVNETLVDMEKQAPSVLLTIAMPAITIAAEGGVVLNSHPDRRTDSFLGESERPIGRTEEVERIIKMLQVSSDGDLPQLSVISIVGFGGLGKTTLAQMVFEEAKKQKLFDEMMWVCVSEPFDIQKILGEMLENLDKTTGGLNNMNAIVDNLQQQLKDKRFLLVLDDVWNQESEKWENLKRRLGNVCGKSGNFVLATTRSSDVAYVMGTQKMVELKQLRDTECWSIIKERVVGNGEVSISRDMENIGFEIAKKCGGVPLAAKVIGGVLSSRKNKAEWLSIQRSNVWNEVDKDKRISGVLKLSFNHLPPPQKLCFAYCSLFPKDVVFDKARLIQLWMAEDFLNMTSTTGRTSAKLMEDVGEEYFHSLLVNSFFQDAQLDDYGNVIGCKMHDLLHDLALSISKSQRLECGSDCIEISDGRRLNCSCDQEILEASNDVKRNLRSLFCRVDVSSLLSNFRRLRSLDMSDAKLKNLPPAIKKLKHLRYLDISNNETIQELPESITKLYNLQTLRVFECKSFKEFPSKIRDLVSLRHLGFDDKRLMPLKVGCLTNLQTLPFFVVGLQVGETIDELGGLKELRGELWVCDLQNVRDKREAERAKMKEKKLCKLVLQWMEVEENEVVNFPSSGESSHEGVMEGLEAPTTIQRLTVEWYMGKQFPRWISALSELVALTLIDCRRCVTMPTLGHLPNLKILTVERMDSMKFIGNEFYGQSSGDETPFSLLEELYIKEMKSLVEWATPKGTEIFPKLRRLYIEDCPDLTNIPLSQSTSSAIYMELETSPASEANSLKYLCRLESKYLEDLWIGDCPKLKFLHISSTSFLAARLISICDTSLGEENELVKNLSVSSNELSGCWKMLSIEWDCETIMEFPKSLQVLETYDRGNKLSAETLDELSCLKHLVISSSCLESIPTISFLTSLKHLEISHCDDLVSIPTLSSLIFLEHLAITYCPRINSIPTLSSLTSLMHLEIGGCDLVNSIPTLLSLTSLEHFQINLRGIDSIPTLSSLTSLKYVEISYCDGLESIPALSSLISLEILKIECCSNLSLDFLSIPTCVKELHICRCRKLSAVSSALTCLEELCISDCSELRSLPSEIKLCTSLKVLKVSGCREMASIDDDIIGSLTELKELELGPFSEELDQLPGFGSIHLLTSLKKVTINGWDKLKSLPHQLQHLTSITYLELRYYEVESLPDWLCNLESLQTLSIRLFLNLKYLPTDMKRLCKLTTLDISYCRHLRERCARDTGPEWSKISHIRYIHIR